MHRRQPVLQIAYCRRPLLQSNRRFISSQKTQPTDSPHEFQSLPPDWDDDEAPSLDDFTQLPKDFGKNQLIQTNEEFKRSLRGILRKFPPVTYAFAYGSGVFPQSAATASRTTQSPHPNPPEAILKWQKGGGKMIDFILTPRFSQHFHSLNLRNHRDHYSFLGSLGSGVVSHVQDKYGAGAYFNPYVVVNGTLIKYAVVNYETLLRDLTEWDTLYFAGRLHKPVKILHEDPNLRVANQRNLLSAVRCALLLLPETFTEKELYSTITGLSYQGDPRMQYGSENPRKIDNIVTHQIKNFRYLYHDLIVSLPNTRYADASAVYSPGWMEDQGLNQKMSQDMDPERRAKIVRRLPKKFRERVYFAYAEKFKISGREFKQMIEANKDETPSGIMKKQITGDFDRRIAKEKDIPQMVTKAINRTVKWPSTIQTLKGPLTAGWSKTWRYLQEKREKARMK
ncbi:mitochondrial import mmp37 [Pyrenophora seminiperda CCB06]|uniref:Phosphatidate cytidylyltransferase, mitochondrial n=1 Tax=Pyrenophora seminiperda CCB06 TaxID=1302712 RepID=A0A3M7MHH5_9PLEO|nr:mitochondrial import mmp37 [Pyrenophora seminiperda CCB06]